MNNITICKGAHPWYSFDVRGAICRFCEAYDAGKAEGAREALLDIADFFDAAYHGGVESPVARATLQHCAANARRRASTATPKVPQ